MYHSCGPCWHSLPAERSRCLRRGNDIRVWNADHIPFCLFLRLREVLSARHGSRRIHVRGRLSTSDITHDYTAFINRLLGRRSPIIDIEHMQLFCPASLHYLLTATDYTQPTMKSIHNIYPLRYWLGLLPLPLPVKRAAIGTALALRLDKIPVGCDVGNLLTISRKPLPG